MSPARRTGARRGLTLVELLVTMTVLATLLGLAAGMVRLLLRLDQAGRDALAVAADSARLARDFRADAHDAGSAIPPAPAGDRLAWATRDAATVEYVIEPAHLVRIETRAGKPRRRERYRRPPRSLVHFEVPGVAGSPVISVVIRAAAAAAGSGGGVERIDAEFGRTGRLIGGRP